MGNHGAADCVRRAWRNFRSRVAAAVHARSVHCVRERHGDGQPFAFDRLGVRVPAILVSPWVPKGTVVSRVFDHASIPATVTKWFLGDYLPRSPRETSADVFIEPNVAPVDPARNLLSLAVMRTDCPDFE